MSDYLDPEDDEYGDRLRRVLDAQARALDPVEPQDDALLRIRDRIQHEPSATRRFAVPMAAAAAAVLVLVGGAVLWPRGGGSTPLVPGSVTPTPSSSPSGSPTSSPSPSPSSSGTASSGPSISVPVYFAASFGGQTMLYREFHRTTSAPVLGALQQMLAAPTDTDYRSLWPAGTKVVSVTQTGGTATVTLSAAPLVVPAPSTSVHVDVPVQEVVYTVTAADPTIHKVTVVYPGGQVLNATRAITYEALAQVWLLAPAQGASTTSPVTLSGVAEVFEAVVNWEIDKPDGTVVASGNAMATQAAPGRWPWSATVTLPRGSYIAKAFAISSKDGSVVWPDTKPFTVR